MRGIGFTNTEMAVAVMIISAALVIFQIPTGVLADRWSRKGVFILGNIVLLLSTLTGALSHGVPVFYACSFLWGVSAALRSGTSEAIVYDLLLEETGASEGYERYSGKLSVYGSAGMVLGALASGVIGDLAGTRATFWLTLPVVGISILVAWLFHEPTLHRAHVATPVIRHTLETLGVVFQRGRVAWIVLATMLFALLIRLLLNFSQLWYLGFALPVLYWGPAYAATETSGALAGYVSARIRGSRAWQVGLAAVMASASLMLTSHRSVVATVVSLVVVLTAYRVFSIILARRLHDALPSHVRAGAGSAVGTVAMIASLPVAYLLGRLSTSYTIFDAAWLVVGFTIAAAAVFSVKVAGRAQTSPCPSEEIGAAR
jgi:MFS family permease